MKKTPCDELIEVWDEDLGKYVMRSQCPFADEYMGYESEMCRVCCGLGVDGDEEEEY